MANYGPKGIRSADWNYGGPKWKLSRSKLDLFKECPLCFYLDNKLGVSRPKGPSFTLNIAVDALLKKEFDIHRAAKSVHPLLKKYKVDAIPFSHEEIENWRDFRYGVTYSHPKTGLQITGAIDDVWVNSAGELIVVDYKATSKEGRVESLADSGWDRQYKRQMEVYQWLFRKNGFKVSNTGYFVYVNGRKDKEAFDAKLEFDVTLIPHVGDDSWVEGAILEAKECLDKDELPKPDAYCEHCSYRKFARDVQQNFTKKTAAPTAKVKAAKTPKNKIDTNGNQTTSLF